MEAAPKLGAYDAVGCMAPLTDGQDDSRSTGFTLSFDHPGKARRRTPDNWREFEAQTIRLQDDEWTAEPVAAQSGEKTGRLAPAVDAQYRALLDALAISPTPGRTTRDAWYAECVRLGLRDEIPADAGYKVHDSKMKTFRTYLGKLKEAGWIGVDNETVTDLKGGR